MDAAFGDALRAASDVQSVARALLPEGRVIRDNEWAAACPYCHDNDKDPKFSLNLESGQFKCFKCQQSGNLISLAKNLWGREWQREWANASPQAAAVLGPPKERAAPAVARPRVVPPDKAWERGRALLAEDPALLAPLAEAWRVDAGWLREQGVVPFRLADQSGYGIPSFDPATGELADLKRRVLPPIPSGAKKSASWPGSHAGLFGFAALAAKPTAPVLVAEGEKDWAVASHDLQEFAVIGVGMGAGTWQPSWTEALRGRDVVLGYDPDEAGVAGRDKAASYLQGVASRVRALPALFDPGPLDEKGKVTWPDGLDLFDFLRAGSPEAPAALRAAIAASPECRPAFDVRKYVRGLIYDLEEGSESGVDWNFVGEEVYRAMTKAGARWLRVEDETWCVFQAGVSRVSTRDPKWCLVLYDLCGQTTEESGGRIVAKVVSLLAGRDAVVPDQTPAWVVRKGSVVYMSLSDEAGRQVRITSTTIDVVENGADGVVTFPYESCRPLRVIPDAEYDHAKASACLQKIASYFACAPADREFLTWFLLTLPLYPFAQTHPVLRFRGESASGKSTCAKAITTLLYGDPLLTSATNAALYRLARRRALTAIDNLEDRDFRPNDDLQNFVLVSATGRAREKAARDTDSSVVREEVKSLFLSTGIEPIGTDKPEIVNRTIEITFDVKYATPGFYEEGYLGHVREERDLVMNAVFRHVQTTLADIERGQIQKVMRSFPREKRRLAEFFSILSLAQSGGDEINDAVKAMVGTLQAEETRAAEQGSSLASLFLAMARIDPHDLGIDAVKVAHRFETSPLRAPDLHRALTAAAKRFSLEMPFKSPHALMTRLDPDACAILRKVGVTVDRSRDRQHRTVKVTVSTLKPDFQAEDLLPGMETAVVGATEDVPF